MDGHLDVFGFAPAADVSLGDGTSFDYPVVFDPADCTATAYLWLKTDGQTEWVAIGGEHYGSWYYPNEASIGDDYEVRVTHLSGDALTGGDVTGAWLALTAARIWELSVTQTMVGTSGKSCSIQVEIRRASDSVVVSDRTWNFDVIAEVA
jgi:hypothetical protein